MSNDAEGKPPFDLEERTLEFALAIIKFTTGVPKNDEDESRVLTRQLLRSGTSIGANYSEATRSRSRAEFISKTGDCLREAAETKYWLRLLNASRLAAPTECESLLKETEELLAILTVINKRSKD